MSSAPQAGVRTYNPSVRVGNWNEDVSLEQDTLKDYLEQRSSGQLLVQKVHSLQESILKPVDLSQSPDGFLRFGDRVLLQHARTLTAISAEIKPLDAYQSPCLPSPCNVSAGAVVDPCARNIFVVEGCDEQSANGGFVTYNQHFYLHTLEGAGSALYLRSDAITFQQCAKKSREQLVTLVAEPSSETAWKIHCFNPQERMESEGYPVKVNQSILINNCKTNQYLAFLQEFSFKTMFGREHEIVCKTMLDTHRAETPANHWRMSMHGPAVKGTDGEEEHGQGAATAAEGQA